MAKENLSHHQDIEETQGSPVAAGSGNHQQSSASKKSVWITVAAVVLITAAVALVFLI